jgi:hypothetical protein
MIRVFVVRGQWIIKHGRSFLESDAMLANVDLCLARILFEFHVILGTFALHKA